MLVGREDEQRHLSREVGQGRAVVITGPAGMGKTALALAVASGSDNHLVTRGIATLSSVPFLIFRSHLDGGPVDSPECAAEHVLGSRPGLLVLDDLQWADPGSLDVIEHLVGRVPLIATVRESEPGAVATVARLEALGFGRLTLTGLDPDSARHLVRDRFPCRSAAEVDQIVATADGNPLLLTQLAPGSATPPTLTAALLDRMAELDDGAREAMHRLSVLGRPATPATVGDGAARLVRSGLARVVDDLIEVHHPLLAELVIEDLADQADAVRRRVSERVEPFEAALLLSRAGDRTGARIAAGRALARSGSRRERAEALLLYVNHAPEAEPDLAARIEAAGLFEEFGRPHEALACCTLTPAAERATSDLGRGKLLGLAAYAHWLLGRPDEFSSHIEAAISLLRGSDTEAEVWVLAGSTISATWIDLDGRSAIERAREAVALADRIGLGRSMARTRLAAVLSTAGEDGWADLYDEALALDDEASDLSMTHDVAASLVLAQWTRGDAHAARRVAGTAMERMTRPDQLPQRLTHSAIAALLDLLLGVDPVEVVARWQPVLAGSGPFRNRPYLEAAVLLALAEQDLDDQAVTAAIGLVERTNPAGQWQSVAHWTLTEIDWAAGRDDDVLARADQMDQLAMGDYPPAVTARLIASHAQLLQGRPPRGSEPLVLLPAWAATPVEWRALVAEHEGDGPAAVDLFEHAAGLYAGHDERSRARCLWAAARAGLTGPTDPRPRLLVAEAFAEQHGYLALLRRVHPLLRRAGLARSAPSRRATSGLTAREHDVLTRVAKGRTSIQIAGELGITRATTDDLVGSALRRLGVSNRRAAVARLRAEGALDGDER